MQLGMGGFPRLRQQPKKNPRKQLPAKLQQARSLLTTIIGSCLKYMQVEAFRARSARLQDSTVVTTTVFGVVRLCGAFFHQPAASAIALCLLLVKGYPRPLSSYTPPPSKVGVLKEKVGQVRSPALLKWSISQTSGRLKAKILYGAQAISLSLFRQG